MGVDLDGTLVRSDGTISDATVRAMRRAMEAGVRVVVATARPPRGTVRFLERLGLSDGVAIHYNGALVWDYSGVGEGAAGGGGGGVVEHWPMPPRTVRRVVEIARARSPGVGVNLELLDRWHTDRHDERFIVASNAGAEPHEVMGLEELTGLPATKLMLMDEPGVLREIESRVRAEVVGAGHCECHVSDAFLLQVCAPGVDKGTALERVARRYRIERRHVIAYGDAPNDAGMLAWAGLGVAVANAWAEAKAAADEVTTRSNDEDGVADHVLSWLGA